MRIVSLLPSVTEIVAALGLEDHLVGRTHECDHPPSAARVPVMTSSRLAGLGLDGEAIDGAVAEATGGAGLYDLDERALGEARPDIIITQALCDVCAVDYDRVRDAAARLPRRPDVLSLEPETLEGVIESISVIGDAVGAPGAAAPLVAGLRERLARVEEAVADEPRPRAVCLEWIEPPYAAGHWVPEQVALAGAHDPLGRPGRPSVRIEPARVREAEPEVLVLMPCGWGADDAARAVRPDRFAAEYGETPAARNGRVVAVDGSSYFNRPGPRVVDGVELLAALLHPEAAPVAAPPGAARWLEPAAVGLTTR